MIIIIKIKFNCKLKNINLFKIFFKLLLKWNLSLNHKNISLYYFIFGLWTRIIGFSIRILIRLLIIKSNIFFNGNIYNNLFRVHALVIIFFILIPVIIGGFGNWFIPLIIISKDLIYPRTNSLRFWILPFSFLILIESNSIIFGLNTSWTLYPPFSSSILRFSIILGIFRLHISGISSILGRINFIVRILKIKDFFISLIFISLFIWSIMITILLLLISLPVLAGALTILLIDILINSRFFNIIGGGRTLIFQHLFWFFGHPEVYVLILPGFGIIRSAISIINNKKEIYGIIGIIFAIISIGFVGCLVWAHHIYVVGLDLDSRSYYIVATIIIGIPTGIKIFNWLLRIWRRNFYYNLLNLWIFGFIFIFNIGGLTGLILSNFIIDIHLHDTYYVVAHFHYVLSMGAVFTLFIGFNLWLRIIIKISNSNFLGILIYLIFFFRVNLTFFPIHFLGIIGMPRKYLIYEKEYLIYNVFSSFGSRLTVFRIFIIIFLIWLIIFNFNNLLINNNHNLRSIESSDFFKNHRNIEYSIIFL